MTYKRKTEDEYQIHGYYSGQWEEVTAEETRTEAKARLREYRENEPSTAFKLVKHSAAQHRVKISPNQQSE
jgi:hypothetical protein